jgi:hypothetical protein
MIERAMTTIDKKEILLRARDALAEIDSYTELAQVLEAKLFSGPSPSPICIRDGAHSSDREVELIERTNRCIANLFAKRTAASNLVQKALEIIDSIHDGKKRAAYRYYYLCHKSAAKIAEALECDEKTVRRWIDAPIF